MGYKILRFFGALIAAILFIFLVQMFHVVSMDVVIHMLANFSWKTLFSIDILRGFIIPIVWGLFYLMTIGIGWIVRGSKVIATLPIIYFLLALANLFYLLFVNPQSSSVDEVGLGVLYYLCAIVTFLVIIGWTLFCTIAMFAYGKENEK